MLWLQSNEQYDALAEYEPAQGTYTLVSKASLGDQAPEETEGHFALLSKVFVALTASFVSNQPGLNILQVLASC